MLTFEQITELIELVANHRLSGVELERAGFRLKIDGEPKAAAPALVVPPLPVTAATGETSPAPAVVPPAAVRMPAAVAGADSRGAPSVTEPETSELPPGTHILNSPIVGTFYASPNPDAPAYVRVGDQVEHGQVLCIVEAMKLMNEIESDVDGAILEIYPKNGQPVEFGEPLFAIQPK